MATCHPNINMDEFDLPRDHRGRSFPVGPADAARQRDRIDSLIAASVAEGASIVVLPELCVTEALAWELAEWVRRPDGPRLLVAGSYHHEDAPLVGADRRAGRHRNTAVAWVRGFDRPLLHDKHSPADRPVDEDLQPEGWPELRLYVTADGGHLVIAICRDLLNPHAVQALTEAGANLVLVPAMSETLVPFGGPVGHLVGDDQAFVVVANNPAEWPRPGQPVPQRPARALVGHPGFGQLTRWVPASDPTPGVAVLHVRTGALEWLPAGSATHVDGRRRPDDRLPPAPAAPAWADRLVGQAGRRPVDGQWPTAVTLRSAAVLVLIVDRPDGPTVLLTRRTPDLTDYPGEMVFPGGAADAGDDGPVATAVREAREETGLDPSSVQVVGLWPPEALPDSGFLVTPVIAWTAAPIFPGATNLAEVDAVVEVPLRDGAWDNGVSTSTGWLPVASNATRYGRMTAGLLERLVTLFGDDRGGNAPARNATRCG